MTRIASRSQSFLVHLLLAVLCSALTGYFLFVKHTVTRTEGKRPVPITAFGAGATAAHAFQMETDKLNAVAVRIVASEPSSLRVLCKLFRLPIGEPGAEDDPTRYAPLYQWTATMKVAAGDHWQRIAFSGVDDSYRRWYRFEIRLLDAVSERARGHHESVRPNVSIMASEDNPLRGGKLWIDGVRQPGSLFIIAEGPTPYERFRLHVEPGLPNALRNRAVQAVVVAVYLWALVTLLYAVVFGQVDNAPRRSALHTTDPSPTPDLRASTKGACQIVLLSAALALFFLVPDNFPDNPSNSLPLFPELVLFGTLCLIAAMDGSTSPRSEGLRSTFSRDEMICCGFVALASGYIAFRAIQSGAGYHLGFDPCGAVAPSAIVRLECRLDASFSQNYAWKSVAQTLLMLSIGVVTAFLTRTVPRFYRRALLAIVLIGLAHALIGLGAIWFRQPQVLPSWIMLNSYELNRFTFFIPYPGYVWLHMAPALAVTVWQLSYGSTTRDRLLATLALIALATAIAWTQQRGGLLLVGTMVLLVVSATVFRTAHRVLWSQSGTVRVALSAVLWMASIFPLLMIRSHTGGMFVDFQTRPKIWKAAIDGMLNERLLFGFGYARWGEFTRVSLFTPAAVVLDSAHSFWIRVLFELGITGLCLVVICFLSLTAIAFRNAAGLTGGVFLVLSVAAAFFISATFEEPDYVRPVIALHALLVGVCCGLPFRRSRVPAESLALEAS
jgi:hypothetical protein